jgi:hypothetical protein
MQTMSHLARICAAALFLVLPVCLAQAPQHKKKPVPKPEPTKQELFEYIRGALLSYSPEDDTNDNLEVAFNSDSAVLTVKQPDGHCDHFLNALNANTLVWEVFDPSDSVRSRGQILRLTVVSVTGKAARTCYDNQDAIETDISPNRARFLFSYSKTNQAPDFQTKMTKAMKKLILLSGGTPEKDIF